MGPLVVSTAKPVGHSPGDRGHGLRLGHRIHRFLRDDLPEPVCFMKRQRDPQESLTEF
jgi:hypothetical protein